MLTGRCEVGSTLPHPASTGLDADHQTPSGVHPGVGLPARRLDFGGVFAGASEVDPGFFDAFCGVGDVAAPGHVAPEERERWFAWGLSSRAAWTLGRPKACEMEATVLACSLSLNSAMPSLSRRAGSESRSRLSRASLSSSALRRLSSLASRAWPQGLRSSPRRVSSAPRRPPGVPFRSSSALRRARL